MLWLKRIQTFNEYLKDDSDGGLIYPGEYYYEDDETKKRISCRNYWKLKKQYMEDNNPMQATLDQAENQTEYKKQLDEQEQLFLQQTILDAPIGYKKLR